MSMPIQRQSEQFAAFDDGPRWARDRGSTDMPKGLAGLVNSMGPRISGGMLNTRQAAITDPDPSEQEGVGEMNWGGWMRRNLDDNGEVIGNPHSKIERERNRNRAYQDWIDSGAPHHGSRTASCEYCGKPGHDWQVHPEAHRDIAEYERERKREEFPFGDHTGADYPDDDDHDGSYWPGKKSSRVAVNTDGMDPNEHAYGRQKHDPLFGEFGHDGYDYEGVSRGEFNRRTRDYDPARASQEAREDEDDESGYNWGPVPPEHYGAVAEDHSGGDEDDPDWIRENSPRQQETNRKRGEEISRSKEMFARRATGRLPFDRTAAGIDSSGVRPGPLVDAPLYEQDPDDAFGSRPYSGAFCPTCDRPVRWISGPDCRHASLHTGGFFDGGIPHGHDVSWEQTEDGWSHPATGARVSQSDKHPGEWEIHLPTVSKRRPYISVGHHPDPQVLMQDHDWNTGYGPAPDWHGEPKWWHRVVHPPLPAHTGAAEAMDPAQMQAPQGGIYQPGHRVGLPWRDRIIPGTVIRVDPTTFAPGIRWDDGQYSTEEPHNIQPL